MIDIRYSTGSNELGGISFQVAYNGTGTIEECSDKRAIFNKTDTPSEDFVGFKAVTDDKGVTIWMTHPNANNDALDGWNISNGICLILKEYENVYLTPYFNNSTNGGATQWYYSDGEWHKSSGPIQSNIVKIIPKSVTLAKSIALKFSTGTGKPSKNVHVISVIVGGEIINFDKILSAGLVEEMNILSDDLPINEFDFSAVCSQELSPGNKLSVYSNGEYFGSFVADSVDKISQNYSETEKVFNVECVNIIGQLDKRSFEDCTMTFFNGPCSLESALVSELESKVGLTVDIERGDPNANYGILGIVPIQSLRFYLCEFAWAICKWICTARRDNIYLRKIPSKVSKKISSNYIIGNATFKKNTPITKATWTHPTADIDIMGAKITMTMSLPASSTSRKVYYDNPPSWIDNSNALSSAKWFANYFTYTANNKVSGIPIYSIPNMKNTDEITGIASAITNVVEFNKFNCVGVMNCYLGTAKELGLLNDNAPHNFNMGLFKAGTSISQEKYIDSENLIISQKISDIQKYIKSTGTVTATVILKDNLANLQVGDMVKITTAFDGNITGIVTKMETSFGYYNTAKIEIRESSAFI